MPVLDLVISILRYLQDHYEDKTTCFFKKRNYLDKALSNIQDKNLIDAINSIEDDFFTCFDKKDINKVKSFIYVICKNHTK